MMLPRRRFSAAELAAATPGTPSATLKLSLVLNLALPLATFATVFALRGAALLLLPLLLFFGTLAAGLLSAWRDPGSGLARTLYWAMPLFAVLMLVLVLKRQDIDRGAVVALSMLLVIGTLGLWAVIVNRHQYIESRLRELAERERALEMARRLAGAQLEPHFLFNTLASLQHWVQTQDPRAATLLEALTGYLRATLPMFSRALHPLADELQACTRYLQVMQARLGQRLRFAIEVPQALQAQPLPPGLLLTLVENAVEHGIEPQLAGGHITLRARREGAAVVVEVVDDGAGPPAELQEGVGLNNVRDRLRLTCGEQAQLVLGPAPGGGCIATLTLPETTT